MFSIVWGVSQTLVGGGAVGIT